MSKLKISFSAILMLIVLTVFSSVALAAAPTAPTGLDASITGKNEIRATWTRVGTQATVANYKVYVNGVEKATIPQTTDASKVTILNAYISVGGELAANEKATFTVEVSALNASSEESTKTKATPLTVVVGTNGILTVAENDSDKDNNIFNANQSGVGVGGQAVNTGVLKSNNMVDNHGKKGAQRTHGEYQNNTNSCASCHQTHTASAKSLLFKDGVYSTCTACHDGTLGFYNVFGNGDSASSAGTFGGTHDGNMSVHLADGAVKMKAAPGGNPNGTGTWDKEFNCASCHSPHGSYSDRLLHYNPNNMAFTAPDQGGQKADKVQVYDFSAGTWDASKQELSVAAATTQFIGIRGTKTELGLTDAKYADISNTDKVIMVFEEPKNATGTVYKKSTNPWMYGYPTRGSSTSQTNHYYYSRLFTADPSTILETNGTYKTTKAAQVIDHYDYLDDTAHLKYGLGLVYADPTADEVDLGTVTHLEVARAYVVKLDLMPIWDPTKDLTVNGGDNDGKFDLGEEKTFGGVKITTVNQRAFYDSKSKSPLSLTIASTLDSAEKQAAARWIVPVSDNGTASDASDDYANTAGFGITMSGYCATCHTDYLASSGSKSGTFDTTSYRHTTTSDSYTCVRCHFAHGTDVEIMTDAHNRNVDQVAADLVSKEGKTTEEAATLAHDYMLDKGATSALKRFTNMSVCWSCHTSSKAEQLKNTDSYKYNDGNVMYDPRGIPTTEGTQNWPKQ
jgi:predicted CXXCH cytochrome family protein